MQYLMLTGSETSDVEQRTVYRNIVTPGMLSDAKSEVRIACQSL
jgi:hypothetical protein